MVVAHFYRIPALSQGAVTAKLKKLKKSSSLISNLKTEICYNVEIKSELSESELETLQWILRHPFQPNKLTKQPTLRQTPLKSLLVEIGPRLNFSTAFSTNAVSICHSVGLTQITRLEVSIRYLISCDVEGLEISKTLEHQIVNELHDRMTEMRYLEPVSTFDHGIVPEQWFQVDVLKNGKKALEDVNKQLGLAFDDWDINYYTELFKNRLKRNPTSVECFDLAQSNSEHSRHWFFKGKIVLNNEEKPDSLIDMIIKTQETSNSNNVIKFSDNSSAIEGYTVCKLQPTYVHEPSKFIEKSVESHLIFTAETHNFPTGVSPFSGATTGTGGRIRDVQAVGRGGHCIAGTAGYSVGNLFIPDYNLPWEDSAFKYPNNFASPLDIIIEASNGASDYGNKFGEPVISGFTRSFGIIDSNGERREWIKPIMFSGGIGVMDADMTKKLKPNRGMKVVKAGGPVYRIGVGGGSASSVQVQGDNKSELDFGAVQRGDPEMEQKLNRFIRACLECPFGNPICSIHDQGAGGNGNVLKELVEPAGAVVFTNSFTLGDPTISTLELWGAEYQENDALLIRPEDNNLIKTIAHRERCPVDIVGTVTGNGKMILCEDKKANSKKFIDDSYNNENIIYPFHLDLDLILGKMPQKVFNFDYKPIVLKPVTLPNNVAVEAALDRVLRLPSVCSKRFLTNKVDRCVTGLIAQQQCVGPLHTPLSDVAVTALSMFNTVGIASGIGEQPIKGLVNSAAGARMTVAESLTNLVFAKVSTLKDVKCSGNWMWAAKLPGEGALLYEACDALCSVMKKLGIAIDGGKDSLSMAARVGNDSVKAPGTLVISTYAPCPDITLTVTPDLKCPAVGIEGIILLIDLSNGKSRIGGSALLQSYSQIGDTSPDLDDPETFSKAFNVVQKLLAERKVISGHDVSDGGLITCLLEMAFGGMSGLSIDLSSVTELKLEEQNISPFNFLFSEELRLVLEINPSDLSYVLSQFTDNNVPCYPIGNSRGIGINSKISVTANGSILLDSDVLTLMKIWEDTSYHLEQLQSNIDCANSEYRSLENRTAPKYKLSFNPDEPPTPTISSKLLSLAPRVAVIREEGINGDREMAASLHIAGFEVWDIVMQDLLDNKITIDQFRGIIFPGGFSYADVLGSAKGWAASLLLNNSIRQQFSNFAARSDTFSLGVCNGCQLMALLGWIGTQDVLLNEDSVPIPDIILDKNTSERFECRFSTVRIDPSPSIMLKDMSNSILGVWIAHGEGRFTFKDDKVYDYLCSNNCLPLKYTDDFGNPTVDYPMNPNGSQDGLAGVCSLDGRHLALMPHPERCTKLWQWPYIPPEWRTSITTSPWIRMFQNAYIWCCSNS
ncbi:phosphoribosylformylglycinamidine synthase [Lycorma delicatula]|uniref:phosphoribosylformylglycinamidine synthase n=1 Tax=Lycorma delicatula TaxID=130591 RepID=UPI003F515F95